MYKNSFWIVNPNGKKIFNIAYWGGFLIEMTKKVEDKYHIELDVIFPWGFEILNDEEFLKRNLRRFFCYFGLRNNLPDGIDKNKLAQEIGAMIIKHLQIIDYEFYNKIVILFAQEQACLLREEYYTCGLEDCLLAIIVRESQDIFLDYSKYIIGTIDGILNNKGETVGYKDNLIARWRLFQLYIILEELFSYLLNNDHVINQLQNKIVKLAKNHIYPLYHRDKLLVRATSLELKLINELILPRLKLIYSAIQNGTGANIHDNIKCFHSDDILNINISSDIYEIALDKLKSTYEYFSQGISSNDQKNHG